MFLHHSITHKLVPKAQSLDPVCSYTNSMISHNCLLSSCSGLDCIILNKRTCLHVTSPTHCRLRLVAFSMGPDEMVDINTLEMIQRPQAQFVKTDTKVDLVLLKYVLQNLQWTSLQDRRNISHTTLLYKIVNNQVAINKSESLLPNLHLSCHTAAHSCPTYTSHVTQQPTPAQPTPLMSHSSPLLPNLHLSCHTAAHSCPTYTSHVTQQPTPAQPTPLMSHSSPLLPNLHLSCHTTAHSCPTYTSHVTPQPTPAQPTPLTSHSSPLLPDSALHHQPPTSVLLPQNHGGMECLVSQHTL